MHNGNIAVGCDGKEMKMTMKSGALHATSQTSALVSVLFVAFVGAALLFTAGLAQSSTLHDAAHDVRHATGFPCH